MYDPDTGQNLCASLMDYAMPRADDLPPFAVGHHDVPSKSNPLGVKGAGEAGCVGAPPAIVNAILDALQPLGVKWIEMPAVPYQVWRAIRAARVVQDLHLGVKSFLKLLSHLGRLRRPGRHPDGSRRGNLPFGVMLGSNAACA